MAAPTSRTGAIRELARVRNASHLAGGHAISRHAREVEILSRVPLVADAEVLGTGPAAVKVRQGALKLVRPAPEAAPLGIAA